MKISYQNADKDYALTIKIRLGWAKRHSAEFNGIPYHEDLTSADGVLITFMVAPTFDKTEVEAAAALSMRTRDVVSFTCLVCPSEWIEGSGWVRLSHAVAGDLLAASEEASSALDCKNGVTAGARH